MEKQTGKKWKTAFFVLLLAIIVFFTAAYFSLFSNVKNPNLTEFTSTQEQSTSTFTAEVTLNAIDLQTLLQQSLLELTEGSVPEIEVGEKIHLLGSLEVLGLPITYNLQGEPFLLEDGNLQIKIEKIKLGNLSLPIQQSLQILKSQIDPALPIEINTDEEVIHFLLSDIQTETVQEIKLLDINKELQEYTFEITLPKESLLQ
ncbi:YpmS family protein [Jeotgalibaca sp. MA1X17-3]|uniref:DUF2140 family protein n=1 Tax=Jeotgalibaca sp. MA1X17-3 TaxID=2908211 RepID=UPI001F174903|nr:DUF2140 family protein [Jeotgalibaca sp. MA1X17-3]UJF14793.1 YpmS family protein [Jeotgalibaca sp. MA1X17-3]